jgi:predicted DNA-binding transcriptional regulator YafY
MMRADRLISIVMLLQTHERMTAEELASELEVSPRTIYRDITALNVAGIPVYTDRGPGGGISLLESYRTTLTGMNADEMRALFMLSIPQALVDLGVGQTLKSALLKLAGALPASQQAVQTHAQQRIYLDSTGWNEPEQPTAHLRVIHEAVWQDRLISVVYQGSFEARLECTMEPLGLVAKLNTWYLVGRVDGFLRVLKTTDILEVCMLEQGFIRENNFDLQAYWEAWCKDTQRRRWVYPVRIRMSPGLLSKLDYYLGDNEKIMLHDPDYEDLDGWKIINLQFESFFRARECILNFGRAAEVLEPDALRFSVVDFARQILNVYQD